VNDDELIRYSRQMILPDWGAEGQLALRAATALVIGAGGLGSPAAMYLAAAGIGRLVIVDDDAVELANLQRQILHRSADVGRPKVESARRELEALNPEIHVDSRALHVDEGNLDELVSGADVVLDGSDNFATRYAVNAACVAAGKPLVTGSVIRWEGQITVIRPGAGSPCYACLFPPDATEEAEPCAQAGIVAPLPGVIGAMQALEAMKILGGVGETLEGRLLGFDARIARWAERRYTKDPACSVCG